MKLIISDIDWAEIEDEKIGETKQPAELPKNLVIDDPILVAHLAKDIEGDAENIAVYLSSTYHHNVNGFWPKLSKSIPKLTISNIEWDKDDDDIHDLPSQLVIDNPSEELMEDINGEAENIANYLSDTFGYCVVGFATDIDEGEL